MCIVKTKQVTKGWKGESKRHSDVQKKVVRAKKVSTASKKPMAHRTNVVDIFDNFFVIVNSGWKAGLKDAQDTTLCAVAEIMNVEDIGGMDIPTKVGVLEFKSATEADDYISGLDVIDGAENQDWEEFTDTKHYPFCVEISIMVHPDSMGQKYIDDVLRSSGMDAAYVKTAKMERNLSLLFDAHSYSGGVAIDMEGITGSHKSNNDNIVLDIPSRFGGTIKVRYFHEIEDAEEYIRNVYAYNLQAVMSLVGFYLDRPVNLAGTSGWDVIQKQSKG